MTPPPTTARRALLPGCVAVTLALVLACSSNAPVPKSTPVSSSVASVIRVNGDLPSTGALAVSDLEAMHPVDFSWEHDGQQFMLRGVPIETVLRRFGWDIGPGGKDVAPADRRTGWRRAIVAVAQDGYRTTFSTAELTAENGPTQALVVWQQDGQPLDATLGPIRLVVPTDKKGARAVRQLVELRVIDLGK